MSCNTLELSFVLEFTTVRTARAILYIKSCITLQRPDAVECSPNKTVLRKKKLCVLCMLSRLFVSRRLSASLGADRLLADGVGGGVLPHLERHAEVTPVVQLVAAVHAPVRTVPDARGRVNLRGGGAQIDTCQLADSHVSMCKLVVLQHMCWPAYTCSRALKAPSAILRTCAQDADSECLLGKTLLSLACVGSNSSCSPVNVLVLIWTQKQAKRQTPRAKQGSVVTPPPQARV